MTATEISLIISSATAFTAIIVPAITARITAKSAERMKKAELHDPRAFDALNELIEAYSHLNAAPNSYAYLHSMESFSANGCYRSFVVACHKIMPYIRQPALQQELCELMETILANSRTTTKETDQKFDQLTIRIGAALINSTNRAKRKR